MQCIFVFAKAGVRAGRFPKSVAIWLLAALTFSSGCGGSSKGPSFGSEEGKKIAELLGEVSDTADRQKLAGLFVKGAAPKAADLDRVAAYYYDLDGNPSISGDAATARVKARHQLSGQESGPVEWSFVKEGDRWKIKSAPLP